MNFGLMKIKTTMTITFIKNVDIEKVTREISASPYRSTTSWTDSEIKNAIHDSNFTIYFDDIAIFLGHFDEDNMIMITFGFTLVPGRNAMVEFFKALQTHEFDKRYNVFCSFPKRDNMTWIRNAAKQNEFKDITDGDGEFEMLKLNSPCTSCSV